MMTDMNKLTAAERYAAKLRAQAAAPVAGQIGDWQTAVSVPVVTARKLLRMGIARRANVAGLHRGAIVLCLATVAS